MFRTDTQSYGGGTDVLLLQFLGRELRMRGGSRMNDKALHIGNICQQREYLQTVYECPCLLFTTTYVEREYGTAPSGNNLP